MKITCQACEAKYTIADEKVQGKVAKMRCKKCGATIIVNGANTGAGTAAAGDANGSVYTVSVAEGDQRTMTVGEIVAAYNAGEIVGETYVWTDGMDDWLPIASIPALVAAIDQASGPTRPTLSEAAAYPSEPTDAPTSVSTPAATVQQAARRDGGRSKVDLFGAAAMAGSEYETANARGPRTPASTAGTNASLTGARNEQSVLFSLNSLSQSSGGAAGKPTNDDSGLIDLGALARGAGDGGRGLAPALPLAPVLGAPVLGTPVLDAPAVPGGGHAEPANKSKTGLYILLGGGLLGAGIVAAALILKPSAKDENVMTRVPAVDTTASAAPIVNEAPSASTATTAIDPTASIATASAKPASAPVSGGRRTSGGSTGRSTGPATNTQSEVSPPPPPPKPAGGSNNCGCPPGDLNCAIKCSASKK